MESYGLSPSQYVTLNPSRARQNAVFPLGLGQQSVHEVCEAEFGDMAALTGFALAAAGSARGAVAWVTQARVALDHGGVLSAGLGQVRQTSPPIVSIQTRRIGDALWAIEEAVRSASVGLVIAEVGEVDFTASRRLALASGRHGVPVILLRPYTCEGSTAAAARWRVSSRPSAPNRHDARAPGHTRWRAVLERSRVAPHMMGQIFDLELNDETLSLSVVSGLASHTPQARTPRFEDRNRAATRRRA